MPLTLWPGWVTAAADPMIPPQFPEGLGLASLVPASSCPVPVPNPVLVTPEPRERRLWWWLADVLGLMALDGHWDPAVLAWVTQCPPPPGLESTEGTLET